MVFLLYQKADFKRSRDSFKYNTNMALKLNVKWDLHNKIYKWKANKKTKIVSGL